jgi:hypothetical protein
MSAECPRPMYSWCLNMKRKKYHNLFLYVRFVVKETTAEKGECPACFSSLNVLVAD